MMSNINPTLSVIMPVWNGEAHLGEAVESILAQTFDDFEFLILDDGSTDGTPAILAGYAARDHRIRIIPLNHEGIVLALNRGVAEARADWIARMDCDDRAHPERFARQWAAIRQNPEAVLCHTQLHIVGDPKYVTRAARFVRSQALIALRLCYQCPISHPTVMFHKGTFLACGNYLPEERHAEDFGLWGRMILRGEVVGVPEPMLDFRVHEGSISKQKAETQVALSYEIAIRHCEAFMGLGRKDAERALRILRYTSYQGTLADWFWFLSRCLPRLKWQSLELWIWAIQQTLKRVLRRR